MTTTERRAVSRRLSSVWANVETALDNIRWERMGARLFALALAETKQHRALGGRLSATMPTGFGVRDEARFFALLRLAEYLRAAECGEPLPPVSTAYRMQPSSVYAAGMASDFGDALRGAFAEEERAWVLDLDYAALMEA